MFSLHFKCEASLVGASAFCLVPDWHSAVDKAGSWNSYSKLQLTIMLVDLGMNLHLRDLRDSSAVNLCTASMEREVPEPLLQYFALLDARSPLGI